MKYRASWDSVPTPEEKPFAVVQAGTAASSEALALRHARAMLEVQRAARAFAKAQAAVERAYARYERCSIGSPKAQRQLDACTRLMAAVARLERIEKEVRGGK